MRQGRRKRRGGGGGGGRGPGQPERYMPEPARDDSSILGARRLSGQPMERRPVEDAVRLDAFGLFCAYHLGITPDDRYQKPNLDEIARRFGTNVEGIRKALVDFKIDEASIRQARFDIEGAQMDIRVCPEGISRVEIARELFTDFVSSRDET